MLAQLGYMVDIAPKHIRTENDIPQSLIPYTMSQTSQKKVAEDMTLDVSGLRGVSRTDVRSS